jgi:hypothetical protein
VIIVECESVPDVPVTVIILIPAGVPAALDLPLPQPAIANSDSRIRAKPPVLTITEKLRRDRSLPKFSPARSNPTNPSASNIRNCDVRPELETGPDPTADAFIALRAVVVMVSVGVALAPGV